MRVISFFEFCISCLKSNKYYIVVMDLNKMGDKIRSTITTIESEENSTHANSVLE